MTDGAAMDVRIAEAARRTERGDARGGLALAEALLPTLRAEAHATRLARTLGVVANACRTLADFPRAANAAHEAVDVAAASPDRSLRAAAQIDVALVHFDLGDYPKALSWLAQAREELGESGDRQVAARCAHAEGVVQSRIGEFDLAKTSFEQALAIRREAGDDNGAATTLNSLGVVHLRIAQLPGAPHAAAGAALRTALAHFEQARALAGKGGDRHVAMLADVNIAGALGGLARHRESLARCLDLLKSVRALGDRHHESLILANAGKAARLAGDAAQARSLGEQALAVAQSIGSDVREREARFELSLACEALGDFRAALAHYKRFHQLERDSQADEARRIAQAQAQRDQIEKAQREAERLRAVSADLERQNRLLEKQARQDALTGLANRRAFDEALDREVAKARRAGKPIAVVAFDLDHFKSINDRHTHAAGDGVLRGVAGILLAHCRASDVAARIGGEEFALLLPGADRNAACSVAERVRREIAARTFDASGVALRVTVSAGVAVDDGAGEPGGLLHRADGALYRAKGEGRDRVRA